jgi:hypothetical protein
MPVSTLCLLTLSTCLASPAHAPVPIEARVRTTNGVPRIEINGEPVRGRIFFGNPGRRGIEIGTEPRDFDFTFKALTDSGDGATFHFRFGHTPGSCFVDDFEITDARTGAPVFGPCGFENGMADFEREWRFWPNDAQNTVGRVEVASTRDGSVLRTELRAPANGNWPDFHVYTLPVLDLHRDREYRVRFRAWADTPRAWELGCYVPGAVYRPAMELSGVFEDQIRLAAEVGVNMVSFSMPLPWPEPGQAPDWEPVDQCCRRVLNANPGALLMPRVNMEPPQWWKERYPDHVMRWESGPRSYGVCMASPVYRRDAAAHLHALVEHLDATFPESMVGYHPSGQNTGEWFYQDTWGREFSGYAPATVKAWRRWLRDRYTDDTALSEAWHRDGVRIDTAEVPTPERRHAAPHGILRDPATEQDLIDFARFEQEAMAECVCTLAHAVRTASKGRKLVVLFYGYVFEFATVHRGPAVSGHYALRRLLESPDIDILCSPISYVDRGLGQSAPSMTATESVTRAGKLWLNEDDTATYLSSGVFPGHIEKVDTLEETNAQLLRNVGQAACRNLATWWMDRLEAIDLPLLRNPIPFEPPVAVVNSVEAMCQVASGGMRVTRPLVYEVRGPAARMGTAFGQYLLDDVLAGRVRAELYVFLNAWVLSTAEREQLRNAVHGRAAVWCYAPGLYDGSTASLEAMHDLTGFRLEPVSDPETPALAHPTPAGVQAGLGPDPFGTDTPVAPLFQVTGLPEAQVLARYANGDAAVAWHRDEGTFQLFCGAPRLTTELLRFAARSAGLHLYTPDDPCVLYTNGPFIVLHGTDTRPTVRLDTGTDTPVRDVLSDRILGRGPNLTIPLGHDQTRILRVLP